MIERIVVGQMYTNSYLYSEWKKECIILDPGGDSQEIIRHITLKNLTPRGIACTHGHLDHTSAIGEIKAHYLAKGVEIPVAIHDQDKHYLGKDAEKVHLKSFQDLGIQDSSFFKSVFSPLPDADFLLKDGDPLFDSDLITLYTPGHTKGSISFYSEKQGVLFSGDTLFFESIGRTDLPDGNTQDLLDSIKNKFFPLPELTRIFPGHGPDSTLEREMKHNPFLSG